MTFDYDAAEILPSDGLTGTFIARVQRPGNHGPAGPSPVLVNEDGVFDLSGSIATCAELLAQPEPVAAARAAKGDRLGAVEDLLRDSVYHRRPTDRPWFLTPGDLQAVKACGVTFVKSMIERVIEERAKGDPNAAAAIRVEIADEVGGSLADITPGSEAARRVKKVLQAKGLWSQYLEVGIGPDPEVFTKCQPMAPVGIGAQVGIHSSSNWNNPEPECVLAISPSGRIVGAALGNDVNLRDVEGRSALLLGKAKDNRGSCAIGPFIRLFDDSFDLDDLRAARVRLQVRGEDDNFELLGESSMSEISRDPLELAAAAIGEQNDYPDGLLLFTGTMFAPSQDRDAPGQGFTHHVGDRVTISSAKLGALINRVERCDTLPPWTFGAGALMRNLAARGLLREVT